MSSTAFKSVRRSLDWASLEQQLLFVGFVICLPFGIATLLPIFRDGDVSWHLAAGRWILANGRIPTTDPFSFTAAGLPWVATEWLSEVIFAFAFNIAGYAGLAAIIAAALIALNAIVFFHLQRTKAALRWATLLIMNVVLGPMVMARPHVLAWPLLAGWTVLLLTYADKGRPPPLWSALLLVAWTNMHTSFPLAAPMGAAIALDSLIETKWKNWQQWALFGFVSLIALMANANGIAGMLQPFRITSLAMLTVIDEWRPTSTANTPEFFVLLLLGVGALLWRGVRIPVGRLGLLLATLGLAFLHVRHQSSFIILAACIIPPLIPSKQAGTSVSKLLLLAALPLLVLRLLLPLTPPESQANPRRLIAAIPAELRNQPVFNGYTLGGPLILAGIKPYIDGRAEIYGDRFVLDYSAILHGDTDSFDRAVNRYGICWVILPNDEKRLIAAIASSGAWRRIYLDSVGVIYVRNGAGHVAGSPSR